MFEPINIGTGIPTSVLELINCVESVTNKKVPYRIVAPRQGDVPGAYALPTKAKQLLNRTAQYSVHDAVRDSWYALHTEK